MLESTKDLFDAYARVDSQGFERARAMVAQSLKCAPGPLSIQQVAAVHRARALEQFVEGNLGASRKSFAAVKALDPNYELPEGWVPEGHPLAQLAHEATPTTAQVRLNKGRWWVDGLATNQAPDGQAFVVQGQARKRAPLVTAYAYDPTQVPELPRPATAKRRAMRIGGTALAAGLLVTSGVVLGLGIHASQQVVNPEVPADDVDTGKTAETPATRWRRVCSAVPWGLGCSPGR